MDGCTEMHAQKDQKHYASSHDITLDRSIKIVTVLTLMSSFRIVPSISLQHREATDLMSSKCMAYTAEKPNKPKSLSAQF